MVTCSDLSRRGFFQLAAGTVFYALATRSLLAAGRGEPELRLGVLSDIHLNGRDMKSAKGDANEYGGGYRGTFRASLEYFRDHHVDAVVIAGDLADRGQLYELQQVGLVWKEIFPDDKLPDGSHVEKVFVYGNHDVQAWAWGVRKAKLSKKEKAAKLKAAMATSVFKDRAAAWKEAFGEDYANVYHKTVKGYTFLCAHWGFESELAAYVKEHAAELKLASGRPFFCVQHPNLLNTLFTYWGEGGCDKGALTEVLKAYPWAVSFSGHSHMALTDDRSIWQGAFTALNTCTLKQIADPYKGKWECVNSRLRGADKNKRRMEATSRRGRQGMIVEVYPDRLEVDRREFTLGIEAGPRLSVPMPADEKNPNGYSYAAQKARAGAPQFPTPAQAIVARQQGRNLAKKEEEQIVISFPAAVNGGVKGRVLLYRVDAFDPQAKKVGTWQVAQELGFHPLGKIPESMKMAIGANEVPAGVPIRFQITPLGYFRQEGRALTCNLAC